ncbi:MAG: hybrid sensor histidine kinase/response regulator [Nitrospinae bacterium]|nr:hybrid sensor histidine kinase/response regulator [Nitrospinota bacterium]
MKERIKNTGILIVDDSNVVRKSLTLVLTNNGFTKIFHAQNGHEGIEAIKNNPEIEFCILDLEMPVMNGFEFLEIMNVKNQCREIPTIVFTSIENKDSIITSLRLGAADYLHKKYSSEELVSRISAHLRNIFLVKEKEALIQKIKYNEEFIKLEKMKANFIDTLTHELKTPLTNIFGLTSLLKVSLSEKLNEKEAEYFNDVEHESETLNETISKLIEINHLVHKAMESPEKVEVLLTDVMKELLPSLQKSIGGKSVKLHVDFPENANKVYTCRESLKKVLLEAGQNAIKFTKRRGNVIFTSYKEGEKIIIHVKDTGFGIEDAKKEKVFDLFYQADDSSTRKFGGTGSGLYLCKKIMESLEENIWFTDNEPKGSILNISLSAYNNKKGVKDE